MSRRRTERKEHKRELARQLGVRPEDAPDILREKQRVTRVVCRVQELEIISAPWRPLGGIVPVVDVALVVVDPSGVRMVAKLRAQATGKEKKGAVLPLTHPPLDDERLRYARPASLVLFAQMATFEKDAPAEGSFEGVLAEEIKLLVTGNELKITDAQLTRREPKPFVAIGAGGGLRGPVAVTVFGAPHRLKADLKMSLLGEQREWRLSMHLSL